MRNYLCQSQNLKKSLIEITRKNAKNVQSCVQFFTKIEFTVGLYFEKYNYCKYFYFSKSHVTRCKNFSHNHYLFSNTIFQENKIPLYKLILGLHLFFSSIKGISGIELASATYVNYKIALLLSKKCKILISNYNSEKKLDSLFYISDTEYISSTSKNSNRQGVILSNNLFYLYYQQNKKINYDQLWTI